MKYQLDPRAMSLLLFPDFGELPTPARAAFDVGDFRYEEIPQAEQYVRVLKHIGSLGPEKNVSVGAHMETRPGQFRLVADVDKTAEYRRETWERCYGDIVPIGDTTPPFLLPEPGTPVRLNGRYVVPKSTRFEADFLAVIRAFLFDRYLSAAAGIGAVYEFGCGTGHNLLAFAKQCPGIWVEGLDWSANACTLASHSLERHGVNHRTQTFDFFHPDPDFRFLLGSTSGSGVLTVGALEQVGRRYGPFLSFLLEKKPAICVHLEPIVEFYKQDDLFDYVAASYHRKRGYLSGFLSALRAEEAKGRAKIHAAHRIPFGSQYHEAYTYVVWSPL